jgi:hypothetical protein
MAYRKNWRADYLGVYHDSVQYRQMDCWEAFSEGIH